MKQILILDDELSITFSLSRCLRSGKVSIVCCNDVESAKRVVSEAYLDAVIADVKLSACNPYEAIDFIRHVRACRNEVPIVMMSGTEDLKNEVLREGATYFFAKPVDLDQLIHLLRELGLEVAESHAAEIGNFYGENHIRL